MEWFKPKCSHLSWTNIRSYDVTGEEIIISNFVESDANFAISSTAGIVCPLLDLSLELMFVQKSVIHLLLLHSCTLRFRSKIALRLAAVFVLLLSCVLWQTKIYFCFPHYHQVECPVPGI